VYVTDWRSLECEQYIGSSLPESMVDNWCWW